MIGRYALLTVFLGVTATACSSSSTGPQGAAPTVLAIAPANGASAVSVTTPVVVNFSQAMMQGMEMYVVLHEGSVTGAAVAGTPTWSADRKTLTFTPATPLKPGSLYVLHLAPTMMAAGGEQVDHSACTALGGQNVTTTMMGGATTGGGIMGGGAMGSGMMGSGWQMANGSYGMIFSFTTA